MIWRSTENKSTPDEVCGTNANLYFATVGNQTSSINDLSQLALVAEVLVKQRWTKSQHGGWLSLLEWTENVFNEKETWRTNH